ncbi:FAD-binding oxidoreductase [Nesterenkonia muleiensis]|uniref:FAD-binding oxidoreductase n=1 Tax=Nesterenkonia muleiensis TaxID=2282648 RepID=UPI00192E757C|nr:FAD-binding oxidoreductase [Nesterenkonia muleiensis]
MSTTAAETARLRERFGMSLNDGLVCPDDDRYDEARRVWNGMIDLRPAAIAQCATTDDVRLAVESGQSLGLALAVRGGGHNVAGFGTIDGGLVIDLSPMRHVHVDATTGLVRTGGGATLSDLDTATQEHGLVVPSGVVSKTGVAGLTLNGGLGWLRRKWGLTCDSLVGATVVTAAGEVIEATEKSDPDLLWGLRGGGGNFGVVTELMFEAHQLDPEVAFAFVLYPIEVARSVLTGHEQTVQAAGDRVSTLVAFGRVPAGEDFPVETHEVPYVGVLGVYAGPADQGEQALLPLRRLGDPLVDLSGPMPYLDVQRIYDPDYPDGLRYYWKSTKLQTLPDEVIDILTEHTLAAPSKHSTIDLWLNGGAIERKGESDTAFSGRGNRYLVNAEANWEHAGDDEANVAWARGFLADLEPRGAGGAYLNFPGFLEEGHDMVRASHGTNYPRLRALKQRLDPDNVFRRNANIEPGAS